MDEMNLHRTRPVASEVSPSDVLSWVRWYTNYGNVGKSLYCMAKLVTLGIFVAWQSWHHVYGDFLNFDAIVLKLGVHRPVVIYM